MKLNLGQDSEARLGQDFEAYVLWRGWCLVELLRLMLGRDSEDEIWSRFVFELVIRTQPSGPLCLWQYFWNQLKLRLTRFLITLCIPSFVMCLLGCSCIKTKFFSNVFLNKQVWFLTKMSTSWMANVFGTCLAFYQGSLKCWISSWNFQHHPGDHTLLKRLGRPLLEGAG